MKAKKIEAAFNRINAKMYFATSQCSFLQPVSASRGLKDHTQLQRAHQESPNSFAPKER